MSLRFHEISERNHQILNPFSAEKLALVGELCQLQERMRLLDLACGKGELLTQWARKYGVIGVGVDISEVFIEAAKARADELDVTDQITFIIDDAAMYPQPYHAFDVVSCIGATWIGGGLVGTLELMKSATQSGQALILVGEPFWHTLPPQAACDAMGIKQTDFATLAGTLDRIESVGLQLVEMVLADQDNWDRYMAAQWWAVDDFLHKNRDYPEADALKTWIDDSRRTYLTYERQYLGWGIFILRASS